MGFGNRREFAGGIVVEPNVGFDKRSVRVLRDGAKLKLKHKIRGCWINWTNRVLGVVNGCLRSEVKAGGGSGG